MTHNAMQLGFDAGTVFQVPVKEDEFTRLAMNDHLRKSETARILETMQAAGCRRPLLVKGAALAPLWPSPALRDMEDIDLVVEKKDVRKVKNLLSKLGWQRTDVGWRHGSGFHLDLSVPARPFACHVFDNSIEHPTWGGIAAIPTESDHLLLIAVHAARNRGLRIWRDLCDATLLVGDDESVLSQAREVSRKFDRKAVLEAFLFTWHRLMEFGSDDVLPPDSRRTASLYLQMATDPISVFGFNAISSLFVSPVDFAKGVVRTASERGPRDAGERDPVLGDLPGRGSIQRQWLKVRLVGRLAAAGKLAYYRRLVKAGRQAFRAGKVFSHADQP